MGAPLEITVSGETLRSQQALHAAFLEVARIERRFSVYRPESPVSRLNRAIESGLPGFVEGEILEVLGQALCYAALSGGAFDPSAGPLIQLWGFGPGSAGSRPPLPARLESARASVGFQKIRLDIKRGLVEGLEKGMRLNFGGIVKGYAIDRAVALLKAQGVSRGLVSFGSTSYAFGARGWEIVLQNPRKKGALGRHLLCEEALSTSGDYERCFFYEGKRFSHLIDPRSGRPVSGLASASVLAPTAMAADALSTAAFVLGEESGKAFLEGMPGISGLLIAEAPNGGLQLQGTKGSRLFQASRGPSEVSRRRFLAALCAGLAALILPWKAEGRTIRYASEKEVLLKELPDARRFVVQKVALSSVQLKQAQEMAGKAFRKKKYLFLVGKNGEEVLGYGIVLDVVGKKRPITFMVVITPEGQIKAIEVLLYRESKGFQIRHAQFMRQFHGKTKDNPLRLGQDIRSISGATLSSRAAAYVARKALAIFEVSIRQEAAQ